MMTRTIRGKITIPQGTVKGLRVRAWDDDWPVDQKMIGEAVTNESGEYCIVCEEALAGWGAAQDKTWHPDVFIEVQEASVLGDWRPLARSQTFKHSRSSDDLSIDLKIG
jgi:hypothetical protein